MSKKILLFILASTVGFGLLTLSAKAEECPTNGNYEDNLRSAMDAVLKANPSLASSPNTEENSFDFLGLVAKKPPAGFNITDQVLNGNDNPNSGDLLAIWKKGDAKMERYDVIAAVGAGDRTIESAVTTQFVGLIPLNCTNSGGGKGCSCGTPEQNPSEQCAVDVYQAGARARDPIAIEAECRSAVWFQRNTSIALSCSSDFIFRGVPANQWKTWSENQIDKIVKACNSNNTDKILAALEESWSSCLPDRKGISCVCQTPEDGEKNSCAMFMKEIGPPTIISFTPTKAISGVEIYIEGTHLPSKVELQSSSDKYTLTSHPNSTLTGATFTIDSSVKDGSYALSVVGISGSATATQKLVIQAGGPDFAGRTLPTTPTGYPEMGGLLGMILTWSIRLLGISIFIVIFLAGAEWFFNQGNPAMWTGVKTKIQNAIIGAIMLLSAYLILYTINPDLVQGTFELPGITGGNTTSEPGPGPAPAPNPGPVSPGTPPATCSNPQALAAANNEPYPARNSGELSALMACIKSRLPGKSLGSQFTFDQDHPLCNYTRGARTCGGCSHAVNSCHYGGRTGQDGALAVDYGNQAIGDQIIQAALTCGAKDARCENASGQKVACGASANHVHVSSKSCDAN